VALLAVSNETGVLQPLQEVGRIVKEYSAHQGRRILMHTDAVQALGKTAFQFADCEADSAVISAHKIGGFKGSGALIIKTGSSYDFLYKGGSQEQGRRPGTENLLGIYSFAAAVEQIQVNYEAQIQKAQELMDRFCSRVRQVPGVHFIPAARRDGNTRDYSPFIVKIAFPPVPGEVLVRVLEDKGILVSTGSACTADNRPKMLRVLLNMQVPEYIAYSAIRVSIGADTTEAELIKLYEVLQAEVPKLIKLSG
jgi:cysteine desulfurase